MKKAIFFISNLFWVYALSAQVGRIGINTTNPSAMLHVKDSSVVFTGPSIFPSPPGNTPVSGTGNRMMWYADKAAFRTGGALANKWDKDYTGLYSIAAGFDLVASGESAAAFGESNIASGFYSMATGAGTESAGTASLATGFISRASGSYSVAMGYHTVARSYASLSIGGYNDSVTSSSSTTWVDTDPLFIIGNGLGNTLRNNAMTVLKNAKTGINTAAPQAGLHIKGIESTFDAHIRLESAGASSDYANIVYDGDMKFRTFGTNDVYQWRTFDNNIRMTLGQTGNLSIDGTLTQNSDARLKKNIMPLQSSLKKILQLNGYNYNWIDESSDRDLQTGVLAQEIEEQMPELVKTDEDGIKRVNYSGMIPYLIEAIKELKTENEFLKNRIERLGKK